MFVHRQSAYQTPCEAQAAKTDDEADERDRHGADVDRHRTNPDGLQNLLRIAHLPGWGSFKPMRVMLRALTATGISE